MKSKYIIATLTGLFIFHTTVSASAEDYEYDEKEYEPDRIRVIAAEFEDRYDRELAGKEKRRAKVAIRSALAAERKAEIVEIDAEKGKKKKTVEFLVPTLTSPEASASKANEAKEDSPKKVEAITPSE